MGVGGRRQRPAPGLSSREWNRAEGKLAKQTLDTIDVTRPGGRAKRRPAKPVVDRGMIAHPFGLLMGCPPNLTSGATRHPLSWEKKGPGRFGGHPISKPNRLVLTCAALGTVSGRPPGCVVEPQSVPIDIDDGLGKRLRRLLRQIVPDTTRDGSMCMLAHEFRGIATWVWVGCPIGVTFEGDRGHSDGWSFSEPLFER